MTRWVCLGLASLLMTMTLMGCQSTYYDAMSYVGVNKREILAGRAESAREAQQEVSDKLASTLSLFHDVVDGAADQRVSKFSQLQLAYQNAQMAGDRLAQRNDALRNVGDALFDEWNTLLAQQQDQDRRFQRAEELQRSQALYTAMLEAMDAAQKHMDPLLLGIRNDLLSMQDDIQDGDATEYLAEAKRLDIEINQQRQRMQTAIERNKAFTEQLPTNNAL
ncbi:DUF2959 family protein [Phytohalomonas tamaricis]|uniref:DUF2959 family protein n=1 Tax=Phytohalomonas tamaricis TaxID=2081032 RepID=UPI000D0B52B1|nr:DUF2959 family protein [Phytohalomonas tamaricis]